MNKNAIFAMDKLPKRVTDIIGTALGTLLPFSQDPTFPAKMLREPFFTPFTHLKFKYAIDENPFLNKWIDAIGAKKPNNPLMYPLALPYEWSKHIGRSIYNYGDSRYGKEFKHFLENNKVIDNGIKKIESLTGKSINKSSVVNNINRGIGTYHILPFPGSGPTVQVLGEGAKAIRQGEEKVPWKKIFQGLFE